MRDVNSLVNLAFETTTRLVAGVVELESEPDYRRVPAFGQRVGNTAVTLLAHVSAAADSSRSAEYNTRLAACIGFRAARGVLGQLKTHLRMFDSPTFGAHERVRELLNCADELLPLLMAVSIELRRAGTRLVA